MTGAFSAAAHIFPRSRLPSDSMAETDSRRASPKPAGVIVDEEERGDAALTPTETNATPLDE